jgi:hypothetical protein
MPTTRPRYQITETPAVEHAIDLAATRWPGEPRSRLIHRLLLAGADAIGQREDELVKQRVAAIRESAGTVDYPPDYLEDLRRDWPN